MTSIGERASIGYAGTGSRSIVVRVVSVAMALRALLWTVGLITTGYAARPFGPALLLWSRWDAPHYLDVARFGYASRGPDALWIAFFPLYPFLVRLASAIFGSLILSGLLVSLVAAVGAAVLLSKLVEIDGTPDEAWRAAVLLFTFPTAYFLAAPYSESVFLLSVLAALYAARTDRWVGAGIFAALATASRLVGIAVLPALAVEALWPRPNVREGARRLAAISVGTTGFITYLAINARAYGHPLHFLKAERGKPWFQHAVWPWHPIVQAMQQLIYPTERGSWFWFVYPARLAAIAIAVGLLVWGRRRLRPADHVFAWTALTLSLLESRLISLPRYLLAIYPLFIVLAYKLQRRWAFYAVVAVGVALQAYLFSRYTLALWAF